MFDGRPKSVLHVAPEPFFRERFATRLGAGYVTADLLDPSVMVRMDITTIQFPDESFDVVYCSHVLEHVPADRKAMREFRRVLKPTGWAALLVPITTEKTFEDATITDPAERFRIYGQADHVRRYGPHYLDRLRESGFNVRLVRASELFDRAEIVRLGLASARGEIFFCTRG